MPWRAAVQPIVLVVVLLVLLVAQGMLTMRVARIRSRVGRLEREHGELSRTVATVQGWAEQQFRAVRGEFTVARVNDSAARIRELRANKPQTPPASPSPPEDDLEDRRDTIAAPDPRNDDGDVTSVIDSAPPLYAARALAPLEYPDLIGAEDIADEAAHPHLGPDEKTPPRRGRAAMLIATYPVADVSEEGGAECRR
jgi:hypothetical protein